jgi:hypothetical protein
MSPKWVMPSYSFVAVLFAACFKNLYAFPFCEIYTKQIYLQPSQTNMTINSHSVLQWNVNLPRMRQRHLHQHTWCLAVAWCTAPVPVDTPLSAPQARWHSAMLSETRACVSLVFQVHTLDIHLRTTTVDSTIVQCSQLTLILRWLATG